MITFVSWSTKDNTPRQWTFPKWGAGLGQPPRPLIFGMSSSSALGYTFSSFSYAHTQTLYVLPLLKWHMTQNNFQEGLCCFVCFYRESWRFLTEILINTFWENKSSVINKKGGGVTKLRITLTTSSITIMSLIVGTCVMNKRTFTTHLTSNFNFI
jgi:hypothetical protein